MFGPFFDSIWSERAQEQKFLVISFKKGLLVFKKDHLP